MIAGRRFEYCLAADSCLGHPIPGVRCNMSQATAGLTCLLPGPSVAIKIFLIYMCGLQGGSAGFSWDVGSPWDTTKVRQATEDAFYGFTEFFRDLDADLKKRRERRDRKPSSLWEELADIGEDFVEFLEGATGRSST